MTDVFSEANDRAVMGGNNPPPEELAAEHTPRIDDLCRAANAWIALVGTIGNAADAERCEAYIRQLRDDRKAVEEARKDAKKPYDDMAQRVQDAFVPLVQRIDACGKLAKGLKDGWLDREDKRLTAERTIAAAEAKRAQEEAAAAAAAVEAVKAQNLPNAVETVVAAEQAQEQADVAAAAAAAADAAKPMVRDGLSGRASGYRHVWKGRIDDIKQVAAYYAERNEPKLLEVLQGLINRDATQLHEHLSVPGASPVQERRV